jgi:drug/metabolite transporter (DMT)-like permease
MVTAAFLEGRQRNADTKRIKGIALVVAASALWGASGSLTKILRVHGFDIADVVSWRYLIGFLSLTIFSAALSKPVAFRIDLARFKSVLVMALCIFGVNAAFTWSNFFTTVANAIALSFTAPLFAAVLAWMFLGEKVRTFHQLAIVFGFAGVCVFAYSSYAGSGGSPTAFSPNIPLGNGLALLSGLLFGWYFVIARKFAQHDGEVMTGTIWQFLILSVLLLPFTVLTLFKGIALTGYAYLLVYSTLCTAAPILMLNLSSLYLKAHESSILALSEVPFSILIGMLLVREFPSPASWTGVAFILTAGFLGSMKQD